MKGVVCSLTGILAAFCGMLGYSQDGTYWCNGTTYSRNWDASGYWDGGRIAESGGIATFGFSTLKQLNQNVVGLELGGINFGSATFAGEGLYNKAITFVGERPFLSGTGDGALVALELKGTGGNVLVKKGSGRIILGTNIPRGSCFGEVAVEEGVISSAKGNGRVFSEETPMAVRGGELRWATASTDAAAVTLPSLTAGAGGGMLTVDRGSAPSATLTVGALSIEPGASLVVKAAAGSAQLGLAEIVKLASAPTLVNGIVDPRVVTRDWTVTPWHPYRFLTYDAERGFLSFSDYVAFDSAGATDIARATGSLSVTADKAVGSLVLDDMNGNITIASGKTLTIGNNGTPAAFVMNFSSSDNTLAKLTGGGSVDFGTSPGIFLRSPSAGSNQRNFQIEATSRGSSGITYATRNDTTGLGETYVYLGNQGTCAYTGPTHFIGLRAYVRANGVFPDGGDVWIHPGATMWSWTTSGGSRTYNQHFHFSGCGYGADGAALWLYQTTAAGTSADFTGGVTLEGDTHFKTCNTGDVCEFTGAVDGFGGLRLSGPGVFRYKAVNTYGGETKLESGVNLAVQGSGTLGRGSVKAESNTTLAFDGTTGAVVSNGIASAGMVQFANTATVRFDGESTFAAAEFSDAKTGAPVVTVGGTLTLGVTSGTAADSATVRAAAGGGSVKFDGSGELRMNLEDGEGPLSVVKTGADTLTLVGKKTYSGTTRVEGGTLKLASAAFKPTDISGNVYWLDASQSNTVFTDDVTGLVTNWVSASGNGVAFKNPTVSSSTLPGPGYTNTVNGLNVVSFSCVEQNRLAAVGQPLEQRTVFIVLRQQDFVAYMEIFGVESGGSYGIFSFQGVHGFQTSPSSVKYMTDGVLGWNGVKVANPVYENGTAYVMTAVREEDKLATFEPAIGGYSNSLRNFGGDVGEVIAYSRVLNDDERAQVENYLSKKWRATSCHDDVTYPKDGSVLAAASSIELAHGATLDLNGTTQTVSSLCGEGLVTNSSATKAVLNITGGGSFKGTICGSVTVNRAAAGASELAVALEGEATLSQSGGTTKLVPYNQLPTMEGLSCWLDATRPETFLFDGAAVTNWASRAANGTVAGFTCEVGVGPKAEDGTAPTYEADGLNGRPCVHMGAETDYLRAVSASADKTIFIVGRRDGSTAKDSQIYGKWGSTPGLYYNASASLNTSSPSLIALPSVGDTLRFNGQAKPLTTAQYAAPMPQFYCMTLRLSPNCSADSVVHGLGRYSGAGAKQRFGEFLSYDRCLTDGEIADVEAYLMGKWGIDGTEPVTNAAVLKGTGTVSPKDGAILDLDGGSVLLPSIETDGTGGTILGNVMLNGPFTVDARNARSLRPYVVDGDLTIIGGSVAMVLNWRNLEKGPLHEALKATGTATGDFARVDGVRSGVWRHDGNVWGLLRCMGMMLFVH